MVDTSVSLLERIAERNLNEDWQRLWTLYRPFMDAQIRRYPPLIDQADDIAQEISLVLMRELPGFHRQRQGSFRRWLRQVTVNQLRTALRKLRSQPLLMGDLPSIEQQLDLLCDPTSAASKSWDEEHDREVLGRVLEIVRQEANPVHWQAFQRHVLDDRSIEDVARELGVTENVVMLAKSRIKKRMRCEVEGLL